MKTNFRQCQLDYARDRIGALESLTQKCLHETHKEIEELYIEACDDNTVKLSRLMDKISKAIDEAKK